MLQSLMPIIVVLSWLALPVTVICVIDDWLLRPRRTLAAAQPPRDAPLMTLLYSALPVLIACAVLRLLLAERPDFSAVLLAITALTGLVWAIDAVALRPQRVAAARVLGRDPGTLTEPGTVDYARSFFPVALVVLLLRSFVFEPFRIPSDSMMPTLLDGDFIIVNKYAYGLRLPVVNKKIVNIGSPQRGDVVVFRYPPDPSINYIKRLVGLPGDRVQVHDDKLIVNGKPVQTVDLGVYDDGCYQGMRLAQEQLGEHRHEIMFCPTPGDIAVEPLPTCNRHQSRSYVCVASQSNEVPDRGDWPEHVIPPGTYLMIGDNRDNSADGRYFGYVPEDNLVGKATRIWFNWDLQRSGGPMWNRIGRAIQ